MNYKQKTPFMELYEALSALNEAEAAEILQVDDYQGQSIVDIGTINNLMQDCAIHLENIITNNFRPSIIKKGQPIILFTEDENGPTYYTCDNRWYASNRHDYVDLSTSWLGFVFFLKGQQDNVKTLVNCLQNFHSDVLDWSHVVIGNLDSAMPLSWRGNGIFVKCGSYAKQSTLRPFVKVLDEIIPGVKNDTAENKQSETTDTDVSLASNVIPFEDRCTQAKNFICNFIDFLGDKNKNHCLYKSEISKEDIYKLSESDLTGFDFYVDALVDYYKKADRAQKFSMKQLLKIFNVKLCGTGDADDYQSIQYLANSGKQERILAGYPKYLTRNAEATHTENTSDPEERYHYLVAKHGGKVTNIPDFTYTPNKSIKVDAKIYGSATTMANNYSKKHMMRIF